jgi:hypothetical protein
MEVGLSVLGAYISCLLPFWLARRFLRWRIVSPAAPPQAEQGPAAQFSIGRLLLWTAGIGASLAAAKWVVGINDWAQLSRFHLDSLVTAVATVVFVNLHVFAAMPCVWLALRVEQDRIIWAFLLAAYCAAISLIDVVVVAIVARGELVGYLYVTFFLMNAGLIITMIGNLAYLRLLGYQFAPQAWPPASYLPSFEREHAEPTDEPPEQSKTETKTGPASKSVLSHRTSAKPGGNGRPGVPSADGPDG